MTASELFDVAGKRALVTGGSSGIGSMIAQGLANAGAEVTIVSRKAAQEQGDGSKRQIAVGSIRAISADLATVEGIEAVRQALVGPLDILVNNAGATWGVPLEEFPRTGFEKVVNLNLLAPFELSKALLPALLRRASLEDPARIINIASIDGLRVPLWESYPYSASKAALIHLTRHMAKTLAPRNISVNAIAPGFFPSRMTAKVVDFDSIEGHGETLSPLGNRWGMADDITAAVIYLSSRAGAWLTGVTLPVSGGAGLVD